VHFRSVEQSTVRAVLVRALRVVYIRVSTEAMDLLYARGIPMCRIRSTTDHRHFAFFCFVASFYLLMLFEERFDEIERVGICAFLFIEFFQFSLHGFYLFCEIDQLGFLEGDFLRVLI
jgi:hypothetical protein